MPWRRKCEGVVEGLVEGWVIGADFGFWILCLDDLVMGIVGVDSLIDNKKGGVTIREGMRMLGELVGFESLSKFREMEFWDPSTSFGSLAH